ncbi:terminase [Henriciella sp.]|uniref:terminase n=1 Tax=Henriciella sp. TaxID=1968823 RepID=UPI00262090A7|nr:terminase [Henriciella sp.]
MTPSQFDDQLIERAVQFRHDPDGWSDFAWDWGHGPLEKHEGPREWQRDINGIIRDHLSDPETRFDPLMIAVASGHGIGKSAEMGMLSNWAMSCYPGCRIVTTANTETQLKTKTSPEIGKWFKASITGHWFDVQTLGIKSKEDPENWRQDLVSWSEHNTEAFAGLHNEGKIVLLLFDEGSNIHDKVWEVAEGALTDEGTVLIWVVFGNPTRNSGRFRECFRRFRHRWITRKIDSRTVPGTNKKYLQQMVDDYGEDSDIVKVRVRGEFPSQSAMQFISTEDADAARSRHIERHQFDFAPVILGVDPAWTGDDTFEVMLRQGNYSKSLMTLQRNDNDIEVAQKIAMLEDEHKADAVFVDAGYGTGIVSAGRSMGRKWRLVWFGSAPADIAYANKRAEIWGRMKMWLKEGGCIDPNDATLYEDIIGPETVVPKSRNFDGRIMLESKQDMKTRGLASPNRGDALALTFAELITAKAKLNPLRQPHSNHRDYDPYARLSRANARTGHDPYS